MPGSDLGSSLNRRVVLRRFSAAVPFALASAFSLLGLVGLAAIRGLGAFTATTTPWLLIAFAIAASDHLNIHFEVDENAHSFVLYELPFAMGLVLCSPFELLVSVTVLSTLQRALVKHNRGVKLWFNSALRLFEGVAATLLFRAVADSGRPDTLRTWGALLLAIASVGIIGALSVSAVIKSSGGQLAPRQALRHASLNAMVGSLLATVGLIAAAAMILLPSIVPHMLVVVVVLLGTVWSASKLTERLRRLKTLHDFSMSIAQTNDTGQTIPDLLANVQHSLQAGDAAITLIAADGALAHFGSESLQFAADNPIWSKVAEGRCAGFSDATAGATPSADRPGFPRDLIAAPLLRGERVVGALCVGNRRGQVRQFDQADLEIVTTIANNTAVALDNARLIDELRAEADRREREATHDALTGLPNRTLIGRRVEEALAHAEEHNELVGLMLLDLNRFKEVNDSLGHHVGDDLLIHVARRLRGALPPDVTFGRLGGDEFAIVVPGATTRDDIMAVGDLVVNALVVPVATDVVTINVDVAVGVAIAPFDGMARTTLMKKADIAMYAAKSQRKSSVALYSPDQEQSSAKQLALIDALRASLAEEAIDVVYQPKVDLKTSKVVGVEALCRWYHPTEGEISPLRFIPLAEHSGLIGLLTAVVLRRALRQQAAWEAIGIPLKMSVNLSAQSLQDPGLIPGLRTAFDDCGVNPENVILEITENELMADPATANRLLTELRDMGARVSIDDFGTGYSSLAYLARLPVDEVKIDRSFVRSAGENERDAAILDAIVRLGNNLELSVVAEGVEDEATMHLLASQGCDIAQGYFISRPIPADKFESWHAEWTATHTASRPDLVLVS